MDEESLEKSEGGKFLRSKMFFNWQQANPDYIVRKQYLTYNVNNLASNSAICIRLRPSFPAV
jgi:hypothetical protein